MNEREFCYWLQGLFEVGDVKSLDEKQVQIVKDHLALVFNKMTPDRDRLPKYLGGWPELSKWVIGQPADQKTTAVC